jgi:23S rRNA (adenine(2503)-C(2))-methyltransferase
MKRELCPKPLLDEGLLVEAFEREGVNPKHAHFIWRQVIQHGVTDITTLQSVPKKAFEIIKKEFVLTTSKVISQQQAKDGSTTKLLIELQDGQRIETVIMRYGDVALASFPEEEKEKKTAEDGQYQFKSKKRATVCVSSQVGCAMGCTFCATGTMNLLSNLSAGEILEQLYHANQVEKIRNVVFMGMGEPLDNYNAVLMAVRAMIDTGRFGLSPSRVTISTVGVVPRLKALASDLPQIGLALSLHAPTQELRQQIVPTSKAWHIDRIMEAADNFIAQQNANVKSKNRRRHILIEYVLIRDVNDSDEVAHQLGTLLQGRDTLLNVIPYNPTDVPFDYKTPTPEQAASFVDITRRVYGLHTLFRQELGQDIASACGQLVIDSKKSCNEPVADMEDIMTNKKSIPIVKKRTKTIDVQPAPTSAIYLEYVLKFGLVAVFAFAAARIVYKITH